MRKQTTSRILGALALSVGAFLLLAGPEGCPDTIQMVTSPAAAVEKYWQLTLALNKLALSEWKEKNSAAVGVAAGKAFADQEQAISQDYAGKRSNVYAQFGTTADQYHSFASLHKQEVDSYYKSDPLLQQQLASIQQQIGLEINRYDAAARGKRAL